MGKLSDDIEAEETLIRVMGETGGHEKSLVWHTLYRDRLRELRARRIAAGREPDDELNAPADMLCLDCKEVMTGGELCPVCAEGRALWEEERRDR